MTFNCLIAGVGGQGTVLASKLLAAAAMKRGYDVRTTETIGMAQRGGSVVSHVRAGDGIYSPLIPLGGADALIGFDPTEAVRQMPYLAGQGRLITCDGASEMTDFIKTNIPGAIIIPSQAIKEQYAKMINVALLGAAAQSGAFPFDEEALLEVISEMPKYRDDNMASFELGKKLYYEHD